LLANVLDPNRVVGSPYFTRVVTLKSGKIESGLLVAEDDDSITIKQENDARRVLLKKEIEDLQVSEKSVMPEGLAGTMSVQDFRDLVRYVMAHPFVAEVQLAGPFPADKVKDPHEVKQWKPANVGTPGRVRLAPAKTPSVTVVRAEVTSPGASKTRLLLGAGTPLKVWLNGTVVYEGTPGERADPDQASAAVELRDGRNVLLIQARHADRESAVHARFLDPDRKLRYPETAK
jgi:hypothetical protein